MVKVRPGSLYHVVDRLTEEKLIRQAATVRDGKRPERVGALEARVAETMALRDSGVTPAAFQVALGYLLATMQTQLSWLRRFANSLRSGRLEWLEWRKAAAPDTIVEGRDEVRT